jgi:hypothetical protein
VLQPGNKKPAAKDGGFGKKKREGGWPEAAALISATCAFCADWPSSAFGACACSSSNGVSFSGCP